MISSLSVGDRLPSGPELERHFGVARSTVEAAVSELREDGLIVRRKGAGTFVAKAATVALLPRTTARRIAITSSHITPALDIFGSMASGLEAQMRHCGFDPVLILDLDPVTRFTRVKEQWDAGEVDGFIHIGSLPDMALPAVPGVVIGEVGAEASVHQVVVDNVGGGHRVAEYLWELGHRRIAMLVPPYLIPTHPRFEGVQRALRERGASEDAACCVLVPWGMGPSDLDRLDAALDELLSGPSPCTAFFFGNDHIGLPGLQSLLAKGYRIPEEVSVVSFDDTPGLASHTRPPLTSMRMPSLSLAALAVQTLDEALKSPDMPFRRLRIPAELIIRESSGPAPRHGQTGQCDRV